jgi:hypothetical protein
VLKSGHLADCSKLSFIHLATIPGEARGR